MIALAAARSPSEQLDVPAQVSDALFESCFQVGHAQRPRSAQIWPCQRQRDNPSPRLSQGENTLLGLRQERVRINALRQLRVHVQQGACRDDPIAQRWRFRILGRAASSTGHGVVTH